ncbi:MAG: hypothetical protein ACLSUZ_04305, partial [Bifidobacterium pseudocatenulatum]
TLDGADEEKVDYKKYRPREWFHEDFYYSMGATIRGILKDSGFSGTDNVGFSRETFDIEIGGYSKAEEQGKGYCAFFNTVMMLAFHDYLNRRSVHAPGWLLIDTPLLGFDEGAYTANGSLRSGLFEHLKLQAANQRSSYWKTPIISANWISAETSTSSPSPKTRLTGVTDIWTAWST